MQAFFKKIVSLLDAKFWKFLLVGVINTLVGMGIMYGLYNGFLYRFGAFGYWISSAANYVFASILSYFLNKHFTFQNKEKGAGVVLRFALNIAVCYAIAYGAAKPLARLIFRGLGETCSPSAKRKNRPGRKLRKTRINLEKGGLPRCFRMQKNRLGTGGACC